MDVDLLRPGTVPISPDTSLWFEFLLDPNHLTKHLQNNFADPTPTELIIKFLTISLGEKAKSRRSQALKILALKVFAYLKWSLDILEESLSLSMQATLLKDFLAIVSDKPEDFLTCENVDFVELEPQALFAISLYHIWVMRAYTSAILRGELKHTGVIIIESGSEELSEPALERSVEILRRMAKANLQQGLIMPTLESIGTLTEFVTDPVHNWETGIKISLDEFRAEVLSNVTMYLMFRESYTEACNVLESCCVSFNSWQKNESEKTGFCGVDSDKITGYCTVVGAEPANVVPTLRVQYHHLISNQYMNIEKVFEKDNIAMEIPEYYRSSLELDITSEISSGKITVYKDTLMNIKASNMVRRALDGGAWDIRKFNPLALQKVIMPLVPSLSNKHGLRLAQLLGSLILNSDPIQKKELVDLPITRELMSEEDIVTTFKSEGEINLLDDSRMDIDIDDDLPLTQRIIMCERDLFNSYDPALIKNRIVKLGYYTSSFSILKINKNWEIPSSIQNAILNIPEALHGKVTREYLSILIAKTFEMDKKKDYEKARQLLHAATEVVEQVIIQVGNIPATSRLSQVLAWELLLVDIHQYRNDWPSGFGQRCIAVLHKADGSFQPRLVLKEECAMTLLNTRHWSALLMPTPKQTPHSVVMEILVSIAYICEDLNKYNKKSEKKTFSQPWDLLLPMFVGGQKRRDSLKTVTDVFCTIHELDALTVVISLLAKIYNVLNDQSHLDIYAQFINLWPNAVKNTKQYKLKYVGEVLLEVLEHALKCYPCNVSWFKVLGDLHFAQGHHVPALKAYISAAIAGTDYFSTPLHKNIIEDYVYKRMIKCCSALGCHVQAGVLCQFLTDVDHSTAFKSLSDGNSLDAMDSYYSCIWDVNLLEFLINYHTKKGELIRKQKVIRMIGLLELNPNNNDEIKREAENIRKSKFMRAMADLYLKSNIVFV